MQPSPMALPKFLFFTSHTPMKMHSTGLSRTQLTCRFQNLLDALATCLSADRTELPNSSLKAEAINRAVKCPEIDLIVGNRKPGLMKERCYLVTARIKLLAGDCIQRE